MKELLPKGGVVGKLWIGNLTNTIYCALIRKPGATSFPAARLISSFATNDDLTLGIRFLGARSTRSRNFAP
jgi:hypothetical protein